MLDKFLKIKKSSLKGAGKGVFTTVDIKKNTLITELVGPIINYKQYLMLSNLEQHYTFEISKNKIISTFPHKDQFARYMNDANGPASKDSNIENNSYFIVKKDRVFVKASKNILKGAEILTFYGDMYWE